MAEESDERLMTLVADGDGSAFRRLAARHTRRALGLAVRMTGNREDAEEIVQEALIRVWRNAPSWRPSAAFRTWFYRVVVNLCVDRLRRRPAQPLEITADLPDTAPDALATALRQEEDRLLAGAVAELPNRQRAALLLTYYEGLAAADVATTLGTSVGGVEGLLVRARRFLRKKLNPLARGG